MKPLCFFWCILMSFAFNSNKNISCSLITSSQCSAFRYRGLNCGSPLRLWNSKCKSWIEKQLAWASIRLFISVSPVRWGNEVWQSVVDSVRLDNLPLFVMSDGIWQLLLHLQGHPVMPFLCFVSSRSRLHIFFFLLTSPFLLRSTKTKKHRHTNRNTDSHRRNRNHCALTRQRGLEG